MHGNCTDSSWTLWFAQGSFQRRLEELQTEHDRQLRAAQAKAAQRRTPPKDGAAALRLSKELDKATEEANARACGCDCSSQCGVLWGTGCCWTVGPHCLCAPWSLAVRKQRDEHKRRAHEAEQRTKAVERELRMKEKDVELARRGRDKAAAEAAQQADKAAAARAKELQESHKQRVRQ